MCEFVRKCGLYDFTVFKHQKHQKQRQLQQYFNDSLLIKFEDVNSINKKYFAAFLNILLEITKNY